jgi:hypothetical protein
VLGALHRKDFGSDRHGKVQFDTHTPMEERLKLNQSSKAEEEDGTLHYKLIGSLRYLVHTQSDLIFIVGYLGRFMQQPTTEHMEALKRVLRYVADTINYECFYQRGSGGAKLVGYNDSDYTSDIDNSHNTSDVLFFLRSKPGKLAFAQTAHCVHIIM